MFASSPPGQSEVCCSHVEKSEKQRMIAFNCSKVQFTRDYTG